MAKSYGGISVDISGNYDNKDIKKAIADLKALDTTGKDTQDSFGAFKSLSNTAKVAIASFAAGAGAALGAFAIKAINAASDVEELGSKVNQIFGEDAAAQIQDWSKTTTDNFGISGAAALEAAGNFGVFGKAAGLTGTDLVGFSTELTELAADMASFNNATIEETITAIGAGLRGEAEPLRRFGVLLDDATLRAKAMEMGIYSGSGALTQQQKVLAAHQVILAQTSDQQGDFERTSDGLANQQRVLQARFQDLTVQIGQALLPATLEIVTGFSDLFAGVEDLVGALTGGGGLADALQDNARNVRDLLKLTGDLATGLSRLTSQTESAEEESRGFGGTMENLVDRFAPATSEFLLLFRAYQANNAVTEYAAKVTDQYRSALARLEGGAARTQQSLYRTAEATVAAANAIAQYEAATGKKLFQVQAENRYYQDAAARANRLAVEIEAVDKAQTKVGGSSRAATEEVRTNWRELANSITGTKLTVEERLQELAGNFKNALDAAKNYAQGVADSFTSRLSLSEALEAAKTSGRSIVEEFVKQGERINAFNENLQKLLAANLDRPAFDAIIRESGTRGADIAAALVQGNINENVASINRVYNSVATMGKQVGDQASSVFMLQGILLAQSMLTAFITEFMPAGRKRRELLAAIEAMVNEANAQMSRIMSVQIQAPTFVGGGGGGGGGGEAPAPAPAPTPAPAPAPRPMGAYTPPTPTAAPRIPSGEGRIFAELAALNRGRAAGGPVMANDLYMVGELGPELFVPSVSGTIIPQDFLGGSSTNITINVQAGIGTDGAEVGRQILDALRAYERRNGRVYAAA